VCKKLIKNSHPFGKNVRKPQGGGFFLTHSAHGNNSSWSEKVAKVKQWHRSQDTEEILMLIIEEEGLQLHFW